METSTLSRRSAGALVCSILLALATPGASAKGSVLHFAAGNPQGNYYRVADLVAANLAASHEEWEIEVLTTQGSYENAELLRLGEADVALLQSDVAYFEEYKTGAFSVIAILFTEPLHIVARRELGLRRVSGLLGDRETYRYAIGEPGSGSAAHGRQILRLLGLSQESVRPEATSLEEALRGIEQRTIDVAFVTSAVPNPQLERAARGKAISLLELDSDLARRLRRIGPFFTATEIPFGAYENMPSTVSTVGTQAVLVVRAGLPGTAVEALLRGVTTASEAAGAFEFLRDQDFGAGLEDLPIPTDPAAKAFWTSRGAGWHPRLARLRPYVLPTLILLAPLLVLMRLSRVAHLLHQHELLRVLVALLSVWLLGASLMFLVEGRDNSSFHSFFNSAIAILHYLFSGLESKYPITVIGNIISIVILTLGVGIAGVFTATLVQRLVEKTLNVRYLRSKPHTYLKLRGHTVLLGWSTRCESIVRQLRSEDTGYRDPIVVVADHTAETRLDQPRTIRDLWLVEGDPSGEKALRRADIEHSRHVLVVGTVEGEDSSNLNAVASVLSVQRLAPQVHVVAEAAQPEFVETLRARSGCEIVDTTTLAERMLSQAVISPGIVQVFDELTSFGRDSQEIYAIDLPRSLDGGTFREAALALSRFDVLPIGYQDSGSGRMSVNPRLDGRGGGSTRLKATTASQTGNRLLALADDRWVLKRTLHGWRHRFSRRERLMSTISTDPEIVLPESTRRHAAQRRIAFCGWNDQALDVIAQLHEGVIENHEQFHITVVTEDREHRFGPSYGEPLPKNVSFVFGDPTRRDILRNAGLEDMDTVVVLAEGNGKKGQPFADHRSLMVALAARSVQPNAHVVVQLLHSRHQEHFSPLDSVEVVSVEDLAEKLLAQAIISPGITSVFENLLRASGDTNEVYLVPVPDCWVGKSFQDVHRALLQSTDEVLTLGYQTTSDRDRRVAILNPRQQRRERQGATDWRGYPLGPTDKLIVLAYERPFWATGSAPEPVEV